MTELAVKLWKGGAVKTAGPLLFGYEKNRGNYRLRVKAVDEWEGLTIRVCWHPPDRRDPPASLVREDGTVEVPARVTVCPGEGKITFEGTDGTRTVTSADVPYRVAGNSGTDDGTMPEPGTPAWQEFAKPVLEAADDVENAKQYAEKNIRDLDSARTAALGELDETKRTALEEMGEEAEKRCEDIRQTAAKTLEGYTGGYYHSYETVLPTDGWRELDAPVGRYWYACDIAIEGCDSSLVPMGTLTLDEAGETEKANIATVLQTVEGGIRFFAAAPVSVDVRVLVTLFAKGAASMVQATEEETDRMLDEIYKA